MNIAAYRHGGIHMHDVGLFDEQFPGFVAYFSDLGFGDDFAGAEVGYGSEGEALISMIIW